eukprot:5047707-Amphidinium_carterae.1
MCKTATNLCNECIRKRGALCDPCKYSQIKSADGRPPCPKWPAQFPATAQNELPRAGVCELRATSAQ